MSIDHTAIRKILYINLAFIGDIILSTPAIRALRTKYPNAIIDMLVVPWAGQAAVGNPYVDHVHIYDKKGEHRNVKNLWKLISTLRAEQYDVAIAANFALRGALMAKVIGARYRVGYDAQHAGFFLTHTTSAMRQAVKHETENQLDVLGPLGVTTRDFSLAFKTDPVAAKKVNGKIGKLPEDGPILVICPFGRHPLNSWTTAGYISLLTELSKVATCYLIGGNSEKERLEAINEGAGKCGRVLAGELTIAELAVFLSKSSLVITVDTGPMHLAGAVGVPVLGLFGRSDSRVWGPRGEHDKIVKLDLACAPCIMPRECAHHSCMKDMTSELVISKALEMLTNK